MLQIADAHGAEHVEEIRSLFREYWASFGFTPCFQHFDDELVGLPGAYAPPDGRLAIASVDGSAAGCVALRRLDGERCELKRLYVREAFRSQRVGAALLDWAFEAARNAGYRTMLADTMPVMERALAMYERTGFVRCAPYLAESTEGAVCLERRL